MSLFIQIPATTAFCDASGAPVSGILTVTPSSSFRIGTAYGQSVGDAISRPVVNGALSASLQLADPAQTSPTGVGYTFTFTDDSGYAQTWANVLIVADENGNFDLAQLNTGQWVPAVPQTVISVSGATSTPQVLQLTSGANPVSAYTAVATSGGLGVMASSSNLALMGSVVGIAVSGAQAAAPLTVQSEGQIEYNGWNFSSGLVFLGPNGTITQTAPSSGFLQVIGVALSATAVLINLQAPILIQ